MAALTRFLWGGMGALTPIVLTLVMVDVDTLRRYLEHTSDNGIPLFWLAGYSLRVIVLFLLGGMWAALHRSERDPKTLFQLGVVAPAMLTGMINAHNLQTTQQGPDTEREAAITLSILSSAQAAEKTGRAPERRSPLDEFISGVLGRPDDRRPIRTLTGPQTGTHPGAHGPKPQQGAPQGSR